MNQPAPRLRDINAQQWRAGLAAWLGWFFDGLDMHLYTLVALPFVAELMHMPAGSAAVHEHASWIMAAFLLGWALGGGFFGMIGDRLGRSRALILTILTYACFTGLSYFAQSWEELALYRFLAALGIGGEWAVGASLLSETWPSAWRTTLAAVLQSAVNIGVIAATLASIALVNQPNRVIFLIGVAPALVTLWIRRAVPETDEWHRARAGAQGVQPGIRTLFTGPVRRTTLLTLAVCALSLSAHWAFMFWSFQQLRSLDALQSWSDTQRNLLTDGVMVLLMIAAVIGNFTAGMVAARLGYRRAIALFFIAYATAMIGCYCVPRTWQHLLPCIAAIGLCQGVFALFTMYLPPLFPTLLRTTGSGFCYNIGRMAAAAGTVIFGWLAPVGDMRLALVAAGALFLPAALLAWRLPELPGSPPNGPP